ncbi:MAG: SusC/RagA family TonB-linked outer membrane protein [Bacteroidota bacterium]
MNQFYCRKTVWSLMLSLLLPFCAMAQGTISGKVRTQEQEPVVGATVLVQAGEKRLGAYTSSDGSYTVNSVPSGDVTVEVNYVGFAKQTRVVSVTDGKTTSLNFSIKEEGLTTEEVLVVGYGRQLKRDVVGSIAKVGGDQLNENVGLSVETGLQGKAPGIQVVQGSGAAGSGSIIRVRGTGSISSGGDPLYIVDGVQITQDQFLGDGGLDGLFPNANNNPLASINPNDIESIEILKDASAAAIYGSRGSNGVIIITTKRGKKGRPQINFTSSVGIAQPTNLVDMLNGQELLQVRQEAWENDGNTGRAPLPSALVGAGYSYEDVEQIDTDWYDQVIRTGIKQEHSLSARMGGEKVNAYAGISYTNTESYLVGNQFERASARMNLDFKPIEKLDIGISSSLANTKTDRVRLEAGSPFGLAQSYALPIYPIRDSAGEFFDLYNNPVAQLELQDWMSDEWRTLNSLQINFRPLDNLNINVTANLDYIAYQDLVTEDSLWTTVGKIDKIWDTENFNWSTYATANYDVNLPTDKHVLSLLGGLEYQNSRKFTEFQRVFENETIPDEQFPRNKVDAWRFASVFFRANYKYNDRFLVQATFRRDGSSRFGPNNRFGNFPSVGLGYILSEESFFKNVKAINFLKLKASWGVTGNADINWTEQYSDYSFAPVDFPGVYGGDTIRFPVKLPNPDLQWEVNNTYDIGFEVGFLQDRITSEFTYYYRRTTDAMIRTALQASSGIDRLEFWQNIGEIENWGVEFQISSRNLVKAFKWKTDFNISHNNNRVISVGAATPDALDGGFGDMRTVPGEQVATNFVIRYVGIDPDSGRPIYLDDEGNETFDYVPASNRVAAGAGIPDVIGGITNSFSYRNVDLSFLFVFSLGGQIYDDAAKRQLGVVTMDDAWNYRRDILDRWRQPGDDASLPRLTTQMTNWGGSGNAWQNNHTLWLEDASYVRLRNLQIGYNIMPEKWKFINKIRLTLSGNNLITWTEFSGADPEVARAVSNPQQRNIGASNNTFLTAPQERSYLFGVNVDF